MALASLVLHLAAATTLGFHRDELLYLAQAARPAFGYLSVPPLTAWLGAAWTAGFGESLPSVRLLPALYGVGYVYAVAALAREMGGRRFAQGLAAACALAMPVSLRAFGLYQPVPLDILLWALVTLAAVRYIRDPSAGRALALGTVAGLTLLNKYLVALWLLGLLLGLAASPSHRQHLADRRTWWAGATALSLLSPNLVWQAAHGWPVFTHLDALAADQLAYVSRARFLAEQAFLTLGALPVAIVGAWALWRRGDTRWLAIAAAFTLAALLLLRGKAYYFAGAYAPLLAAGAKWLAIATEGRRIWRAALALAVVLPSLALLPAALPFGSAESLVAYCRALESATGLAPGLTDERGRRRPLPQDYADMLGWESLGGAVVGHVDNLLQEVSPERIVVYAENYGQAAAIEYAFRQNGLRLPVLSFHESYLLWSPEALADEVTHFVYVNDELGADVAAWFGRRDTVFVLEEVHARERGAMVVSCSWPLQPVAELWAAARAGRRGF